MGGGGEKVCSRSRERGANEKKEVIDKKIFSIPRQKQVPEKYQSLCSQNTTKVNRKRSVRFFLRSPSPAGMLLWGNTHTPRTHAGEGRGGSGASPGRQLKEVPSGVAAFSGDPAPLGARRGGRAQGTWSLVFSGPGLQPEGRD